MDSAAFKRIMGEIGRPKTRSPLFWWLLSHHDRILAEAAGGRLNWRGLVQQFAEAGLTNADGRPASPVVPRLTWKRVRSAVAQRRAEHERLAADEQRRSARRPSLPAPTGRSPDPPVSWVGPPLPAGHSPNEGSKAPGGMRSESMPAVRRWYDDDPSLTDGQRAHLRSQDERVDAEIAKLDAKFRLGR